MLRSIFNRRDGSDDALIIRHFLRRVQRDVEVHLKQIRRLAFRSIAPRSRSRGMQFGEGGLEGWGRGYSDQDPLVLEVNVCDGELVRQSHFDTTGKLLIQYDLNWIEGL